MNDTRLTLGPRIVVTGLAGSGKSTLALALGSQTGLPVIHLDLEFWKPGWTAPSESEWRQKQDVVLGGCAWIAEGNYHETLDLRVERADDIVVLDMPWWLCSFRALRRGLTMPDQLPDGCEYSRWQRFRDEWQLAGRIWRNHRTEPAHERRTISCHGTHAARHVLRSRSEADDFVERAVLSCG